MSASYGTGLKQVYTDGSLTGKGTPASPLAVPASTVSSKVFTYTATGSEATATNGSSDFVMSFSGHGSMPSTAYNADVRCGGCADIYDFDVVLADNTTTTIHVKCSAKLISGDVLQVTLRTRTTP